MQDFYEVKVGDRLWVRVNNTEGWAKVIRCSGIEKNRPFPILVSLPSDYLLEFTVNGQYAIGGPQCLFYGPPQIIVRDRPMRTRKVQMEVRPFIIDDGKFGLTQYDLWAANLVWCGAVQTIEVEVEE